MNDHDDVLLQARDSLSGIHMQTPVEAIVARGHARRSRTHRRRLTGLSAAGAAAVTVVALGVTGVIGGGRAAPAPAAGTIRTAAFTLVKNANGTATLSLSENQVFNPAALQQALAQDGIPALIKIDSYCTSDPAPPRPDAIGVISTQLPGGGPVPKSTPGDQQPLPPGVVTVINPAAMPAGTELFFDYTHSAATLTGDLIYQDSYSCGGPTPGSSSAP